MASTMMASCGVLPVPSEVTEHTLAFLHPCDVSSFSKTCRNAFDLIYKSPDQYLWRQLFLAHFDDPRKAFHLKRNKSPELSFKYDWKRTLQRRTAAELVARSREERLQDVGMTIATFVAAMEEALPLENIDCEVSLNTRWLNRILHDSKILDTKVLDKLFGVGIPDLPHRLLSYMSLSHIDHFHYLGSGYIKPGAAIPSELVTLRTRSRCFVYDLRHYTSHTLYGPYENPNTINWTHVEYNINVILMNLREAPNLWPGTRPPVGLDAMRAYSAPGTMGKTMKDRDWAGVEGTWRRFVCFMDYRDLFSFNVGTLSLRFLILSANPNPSTTQFGTLQQGTHRGPRNPLFFSDTTFQEATRLVETRFTVISDDDDYYSDADRQFAFVGHPAGCCALSPEDPPPIHFVGTSNGSHGNESMVKGCVKVEAGGIRWKWVSIQGNQTQWSAEAIQLGQVCSAAGAVGNWTGAYHEEGDPAGPFWLWKVPENHISHLSEMDDY